MSFSSQLNSGVSALRSFSRGLQVIGDNIANVNTWGFKASRTNYADSFSNTLQASGGGANGALSTPSSQVGMGVNVSDVGTRFSGGALTATDIPSDLAIEGEGFFEVRDPVSGTTFLTRAGNFSRDDQGFLRSSDGFILQGNGTLTGTDFTIPLEVDGVAVRQWGFGDTDGILTLYMEDNTTVNAGTIDLVNVPDPQGLRREGGNLFSGYGDGTAAGAETRGAPGEGGLGRVRPGALELSNADLTEEFANMITTQRSFQAGARVITTADQVIQEVINLKR